MARLGVAVSGGPNPSEIVDCVKLAESLGYESAWVAEGHGGDQFAVLAACAAQTTRIKLGTSISSVFVRTAPTIAMAAGTIDELSDGRFILGLGSSHKVQVEPEHGVPYAKPLSHVRDAVAIVRALLRDGEVQYAGEAIRIENFDLWFRPYRADMPIYISALFPKMMRLCGEISDGVILTRSTLETAEKIKPLIAEGAVSAGRDPGKVDVTSLLPMAVADTLEAARDIMRPGVAFYAGFFPRYNRLIAEYGFAEEAAAISKAWAQGDRAGAARLVTDAMVDATGIVGTSDDCRARINEYRDAGLDLPIISPFARGPGAKAVFEAAIRACAPD
jgi:probable F420-dependent oxidoreductase